MQFMNKNANYTNMEEEINAAFKLISGDIETISARKSFDKAEIANLADTYEKIRNYSFANADTVIDAFTEYKGISTLKINNVSSDYELILDKGSKLKQAVLSYSLLFESKVSEINAAKKTEEKSKLVQELADIVEKLRLEVEKFNESASDTMNSFVPLAIQSKNQFYAQISKYIKEGVPQNLNLENKDFENAFIDALLEALAYKGTPLA